MSTTMLTSPAAEPGSGTGRRPVAVFLPREHGSWSLVLEPLALGLLVAPSGPGGLLALATAAAFLARRPLKSVWFAEGGIPRGAATALVVLATLAAAAGTLAWLWAGAARLWPLALAVPPAVLFVRFDLDRAARAAIAELAGAAACSLLPVALATLAGWSPVAAAALGATMLARSLPTILTLRTVLRRAKGERATFTAALLAATAATAGLGGLAWRGLVPGAVAGLGGVLLVRTLWLASPWRPLWPARRLGICEAILGAVYVVGCAATPWSSFPPVP